MNKSVTATCAFAMGIGAALGFTPGFVATALRDDLAISHGQVGLLVSLYFGSTGLGSVAGGRLTDRWGARIVIVLDMIAVAAASLFSAVVGSYWSLVVAAVVAGSAYALANAGTNVAIAATVDPRRRTLAMSIKTAGVPLMAAAAAAVGPTIADRWSWQRLSVIVGVLAVLAAVVAARTIDRRRPAGGRGHDPISENTAASSTPILNLSQPAALPTGFAWFPIGAFLLIAGSQPLYSWLVAYLEQEVGASPGVAGAISASASIVGVSVMLVNATGSDRVGSGQRIRRIEFLIGLTIVATLLVLGAQRLGLWLAAVGTMLGIAVQLSAIGTMHSAIVDRAPNAVGRATGLTMTGYYLGALISPFGFGVLADLTGTFTWSWAATAALLALAVPAWALADRIAIMTPTDGPLGP